MEKLTGRTRHRCQSMAWKPNRLILQVERTYVHTSSLGGHIESEVRTDWRDAQVEDLAELARLGTQVL